MGRSDAESETLIPIGGFFDRPISIQGAGQRSLGPHMHGCGISSPDAPMYTLNAGEQHAVAQPLSFAYQVAGSERTQIHDTPRLTRALTTQGLAVAFDTTQITSAANYSRPKEGDPCHPLAAGAQASA